MQKKSYISHYNFAECSPGFTGTECSLRCRYPLFGQNCQQICKCFITECDIASGCVSGKYIHVFQNKGKKYFYKYKNCKLVTGTETSSANQHVTAKNYDKHINQNTHLEEKQTSTVPKITETIIKDRSSIFPDITDKNIRDNLENRIQTMWQLMLMILAVLLVFALTYLGKCLHRQWTNRTVQVSNTNNSGPGLASNESRQIQLHYEQIQDLDDRQLYLTAVSNESHGALIVSNQITSSEKIDSVSNRSIRSNLELSSEEDMSSENVSENVRFDNQRDSVQRETSGLYITPIL